MAFAPDGRLFVCEQGGALRVVKNGALLATPFVSLGVDASGERGLLGVAFDPDFATNQWVYVYYTATTPAVHNRVSRFTASGDVAAPGSETVILDLDDLSSATNHNGGALHFGPDGKLYVAVGENANGSNSQTLANLLGKMLRIDKDGAIPSDNPFFADATGKNRAIWALGLRNPFTFSFDRASGRMFINDVGQDTWEEIDDGIAGSNYGWPTTEGETSDPRYVSPLFAYDHSHGCAITGGAFYDAASGDWPAEFDGDYFYADFCGGFIRRYHVAADSDGGFASGIAAPVDLVFHADGSLYYLARGGGAHTGVVTRIDFTANDAPRITSEPQGITVSEGRPARFKVSASGADPLSYQWQRDGADIPGATERSYDVAAAQLSDSGARFRCEVTNDFGGATSAEAVLTVIPDQPPLPRITAPLAGTRYRAGDTIDYAGKATDPEDGKLPRSAFTWQVDFHHDDHVHPFLLPTSGRRSGSFTIPRQGETAADVFYRILLTVSDSAGNEATTSLDLLPRTSTITLQTDPPGLAVLLDGQPQTAPYATLAVVGMTRALEAPSPQDAGGASWLFDHWSDDKPQAHTIRVKGSDRTYVAVFRAARP